MSDLHGKDARNICSKLDVIQTTMTSIEIEKFTGDWLQKWEVKDMEITLDRHDTILAKNKSTKSYKNGQWWPGKQARSMHHPGLFSWNRDFLIVQKNNCYCSDLIAHRKLMLYTLTKRGTFETSENASSIKMHVNNFKNFLYLENSMFEY